MGCDPFQTADGARGFICTRGRKPRKKCACGKVATLLCDAPRLIGTCDAHICARCAVIVGEDLHHCPKCAPIAPAQIPIPAPTMVPARRPPALEVEALEHDSRVDGSAVRDGWPMPWRILPASRLPPDFLMQLALVLNEQRDRIAGGHHG